jgi:hypothetical protein
MMNEDENHPCFIQDRLNLGSQELSHIRLLAEIASSIGKEIVGKDDVRMMANDDVFQFFNKLVAIGELRRMTTFSLNANHSA